MGVWRGKVRDCVCPGMLLFIPVIIRNNNSVVIRLADGHGCLNVSFLFFINYSLILMIFVFFEMCFNRR
jgi:hypothetical protein